jgi:hypothetical protein
MKATHRSPLLAVFALSTVIGASSWVGAQQPSLLATQTLTPEQMEHFLLNAQIVATRDTEKGITNSRRATLSDGQIKHDVHIQIVDISQPVFVPARGPTQINFRDSYRYNIAGYRLALLLGLDHVPMSVERSFRGTHGAFTWWVDDVLMDDAKRLKGAPAHWRTTRTAGQIHIMRVFDELIANTDRNVGNLLWTTDGKMWMIDHTRAFRLQTTLRAPQILQRCDRNLLKAMRELSAEQLKAVMGDSLNRYELEALLARRDLIVKLFEEKIADRGEAAILYTLER